ncbi:MAG: RNA 2',3'-cyclic phosphodiesterase [Thermoplasmata archaeon]
MRVFVAVPLSPEREGDERRAPEHLTLRFLGETPERSLPPLEDRLCEGVARHAGFEMVIDGVGAFPSADRPRVVWRGVGTGEGSLRRLALDVREAVVSVGFPEDPVPFAPHVTLFRVRSPADRERALSLLKGSLPAPPPSSVRVREVHLVESRLTPAGAIHRVRTRFPLGPVDG